MNDKASLPLVTASPGPWSVSGVRIRQGGEPFLQIMKADGRTIALVSYSDLTPRDHVESHADARLMAAAWEIFNAIANSDDAHWTTAMRAAMSKARGDSQ